MDLSEAIRVCHKAYRCYQVHFFPDRFIYWGDFAHHFAYWLDIDPKTDPKWTQYSDLAVSHLGEHFHVIFRV